MAVNGNTVLKRHLKLQNRQGTGAKFICGACGTVFSCWQLQKSWLLNFSAMTGKALSSRNNGQLFL